MTKISLGKKYETRSGNEVIIYAVHDGYSTPVHGAIKILSEWVCSVWNLNGEYRGISRAPDYDLLQVEESITKWVNIYEYQGVQYISRLHPTKEIADACSELGHRVACTQITYTEGEGL